MCRECGYTVKCKNCDISLTYHKTENKAMRIIINNVRGQRVLSSLVQFSVAFILPQNEHNKTDILLAKHPFYSRFCGILNITKDLKGFLLQGLFVCY